MSGGIKALKHKSEDVKLHQILKCYCISFVVSSRMTVVAVAAFLDAFQKVADLATNSRGNVSMSQSCCLWFL